jgi:hypothetical protein
MNLMRWRHTRPEENDCMNKFMLAALAAATLAMTLPASAQSVRIGDGPGGGPDVRVRVGPGHSHHRAYARERCRTVVTRSVRPNGTTVTKRVRRCR